MVYTSKHLPGYWILDRRFFWAWAICTCLTTALSITDAIVKNVLKPETPCPAREQER